MYTLGKNCATFNRLLHCYFDKNLKEFNIGSGQQFCIIRILESPGTNCKVIAENGHFDLGTILRATQKLESLGYIESVVDENDRRIKKLYVTESGKLVAEKTKKLVGDFYKFLLQDFSSEEILNVCNVLDRVIEKTIVFLDKEENNGRK